MSKLKIERKGYFWAGIIILALSIIFYFIRFQIDSGSNFITYDSLLGIIILHNPFILGLLILIIVALIAAGFRKKEKKNRRN